MIIEIGKPLELARESQIKLFVNYAHSSGSPIPSPYHIMCTPENVKDLVVGFLVSEGIAKSVEDIEFSRFEGQEVVVSVNGNSGEVAITSSGSVGIYRDNVPKVIANEKYTLDELRRSLEYLNTEEYRRTRGYHTAAIVGKDGLICRRYDVGRHNAVDKAIGAALLSGVDLSKTHLVLSGRISRGMAMKCARAGIPLIVSKAAILDSAIEVCKKSGLAAVSFATNIAVVGEALEI